MERRRHSSPPRRPLRSRLAAAGSLVAAATLALGFGLATAGPAAAAPTSSWASWTSSGSAGARAGSVSVPAHNFPSTTWVSNSSSASTPVSATLNGSTPPGAHFGTSSGKQYLLVGTRASSPSTTTFTFSSVTPATGWGFVLGDIDADRVTISARDADGAVVSSATIDGWEQGTFNYAGNSDRPTWVSPTLTGSGSDTDGASDWFEPDVALSSLTFTFSLQVGFPSYQIWFAALAHDVTGQVTGSGACAPTNTTVQLVSPTAQPLATTTPAADGSYSFAGYVAENGYQVSLVVPAGCRSSGVHFADLTTGDATANFAVTAAGTGSTTPTTPTTSTTTTTPTTPTTTTSTSTTSTSTTTTSTTTTSTTPSTSTTETTPTTETTTTPSTSTTETTETTPTTPTTSTVTTPTTSTLIPSSSSTSTSVLPTSTGSTDTSVTVLPTSTETVVPTTTTTTPLAYTGSGPVAGITAGGGLLLAGGAGLVWLTRGRRRGHHAAH
jgi:hypothetical protein